MDREIDPQLVRRATRRNLLAPLIYLLAIGISFRSVQLSLALFILVPVFYIFPGRIDRHWMQRRRIDETSTSANKDDGFSDEEAPPVSRGSSEEQ